MKKSQRSSTDLSYVDPPIEAASCLRIAHANGGVAKMRELIEISPEQERILHRLAAAGELSQLIVWRALAYRAQVLEEFERLVTRLLRAKKIVGQRSQLKHNRGEGGTTTMKFATELDPVPVSDGGEPLEKHKHLFSDGQRVVVIEGLHAGRTGSVSLKSRAFGHRTGRTAILVL